MDIRTEDLQLVAVGLTSAVGAVVLVRQRGAALSGAVLGATLVFAALVAGRLDSPGLGSVYAAIIVGGGAVAIRGAHQMSRYHLLHLRQLMALLLMSTIGVWLAVPETGPVLVVGGVLVGTMGGSILAGVRLGPGVLEVGVAGVTWGAAVGSSPSLLATIGAAGCLGLMLWWPFGRAVRAFGDAERGAPPGSWLLLAHTVVVAMAARWVGASSEATWLRVTAIACVGIGMCAACRVTRVSR